MKKIFAVALGAAMLGSILVLGGAKALGFIGNDSTTVSASAFQGQVKFASLNGQSTPVNMNFTAAASKTLPVVVNIQSATRMQSQRGGEDLNLPEPFRQYFGPRMFRDQSPNSGRKNNEEVQMGTGSGVIISPDGYIVTNNHVVAGADELTVTLNDKRAFKAKVIGTDPSTDLGLIKIEASALPFINFSNSDAVQVGEWVLAVGNPFNLTSTVTAGIVSAKGRDIHILQDKAPIESFIQTDAAINPGNSGGALVNLDGDLIGINAAIASPTGTYTGYGFAIPANIVAKVVDDLKKFGVPQRGYLGVIIREVNSQLVKDKNLGVNEGVYVDSLAQNSSAASAGIHKGDVITKIDNQTVDASSDVMEAVAQHRPGDQVKLLVWRNGSAKEFLVTLKNKQGNTDVVKKTEGLATLSALGAEFKTLGEKEAKKMEIAGGVVVVQLGEGKLSNQTDMEEGFVITKVDGKTVKSVEDLNAQLKDKEGGIMLEGIYPDRSGSFYYAFGM